MTEDNIKDNWEDQPDSDELESNPPDKHSHDEDEDINIDEDVHLNDIWTYHFHCPTDQDWNISSYLRINDVSTVQDFWKIHNNLGDKLKSGIFFIMREHVFPSWDSPENINGGCLSIKVLKENLVEYWEKLCTRVLGENLLIPELKDKWDLVNGISTSPKRYFCIVKIWMSNNDLNDKKFFQIPENYYGDVIYVNNMENIQKNNK
jgi:hypothetical protein